MIVTEESLAIYTKATILAQKLSQTVGKKNDYYITLEQLERIIQEVTHD